MGYGKGDNGFWNETFAFVSTLVSVKIPNEMSQKTKSSTKNTVLKDAQRVESELERKNSNWLGDNLVANVSGPLFLAFGIWAALTKSLGYSKIQPQFSLGFWFDDLFASAAVFAVFLVAWGAEDIKAGNAKKMVLFALAGFYGFGGIALFSFSIFRFIGALLSFGLAAVHVKGALEYRGVEALPSANAAPLAATALARTLMLVDAGVLGAAAFLRIVGGIDEVIALPDQPQVRLAVPFVIILAIVFFLATTTSDIALIRDMVITGAFLSLAGANIFTDGNMASGYMTGLLAWVFRASICVHVFVYSRPPIVNPVMKAVRKFKQLFGKLGKGSDGFGDE